MTYFQDRFRLLAVGLCLTPCFGCHTARPKNPEFDTLLQSVTYDTSLPPLPHAQTVSYVQPDSTETQDPDLQPEPRSIGKSVGDGVKATAALVVWGMIKVVESTLGFDDDKNDDSTPRGRADQDRDRWIADRDRWKKAR